MNEFKDKWICTDPDSFQWQRRIGEREYEMVDIIQVDFMTPMFKVAYGSINLDWYADDEIEHLHRTYGYDERQEDRIVAEMAFEHDFLEFLTDGTYYEGIGACSDAALYLVEA